MSFYGQLALKLFGSIPENYPEIFKQLNSELPKSGMNIPKKVYDSIVIMNSFLMFLIGIIAVFVFKSLNEINIFSFIIYLIFIPIIFFLIGFVASYFYPIQKTASRRANIEANLPFVVAHMGSIASSGITPSSVFKLLSKFEDYGVLSKEMEKIVTNIEVFGLDPVTAMKEVAKRTPSEKFKQLLLGFASTIESGGSLKFYLKNMSEQTLFHWKIKREKYIQQLSAYAEFYTGILIAAPLFIISLFSVMNMIEPNLGGIGIFQLMKISIYALIPLLNIVFMLFLSATQVEI
ncbi:MAG: type II secretion system F family protein [Candidatus Aenigmatarchaeota archaeon]|nr:type II secretion system F family protein [Candidatus Aenigmarchaeota archaeon]